MKNWSFKRKNLAVTIAIPVLLILGYFLSFSRTIALQNDNERLRGYETQEDNLPLKIAAARKRIQTLDSIISINEVSYQARLLHTLTDYCKQYRTSLIEVKDVDFKQYEKLPYDSYRIKIEGKYINLVKTLNALEQNFGLGKVQSISYQREEDRRTKRVSLALTIYLTRVNVPETNKKRVQ